MIASGTSRPFQTVADLLAEFEDKLARVGVDSPRLSARMLLGEVLNLDHAGLVAHPDRPIEDREAALAREMVARREKGEPAAYILGRKEFYGLDFRVGRGVLVPRPETEHIIDFVLEEIWEVGGPRFADLGTGSGALAVALGVHLKSSRGLCLDRSRKALTVARLNMEDHCLENRLMAVQGDFGQLPVKPGSLDLVVSNPPYVPQKDYAGLDQEVRDFEPFGALVAGRDGLDAYRDMAPTCFEALRPGGLLFWEIGHGQGERVAEILHGAGFPAPFIRIRNDYAGLERVACAVR